MQYAVNILSNTKNVKLYGTLEVLRSQERVRHLHGCVLRVTSDPDKRNRLRR
jgi:hypothetical protein